MKCPNCGHAFEHENNRGKQQRAGMRKKASMGLHMSRPAFGYKLVNGKLEPAENFREVEDIFNQFLEENMNLSKLSKKYNISINGIKKILKNFTYVGKIKFNDQVHEGNHKPLLSATLFNQVQDKLEKLGLK